MPVYQVRRGSILPVARREMANRLAAAAIFYIGQHQARLNRAFPPASRPGQYPAKRTGFGQKSVRMVPFQISEIERTLVIQVGYDALAPYMPRLEVLYARLGLQNTLAELVPLLERIIGTPIDVRYG